MIWVTRENVHVDRTACPWLIRRFIDKKAEFRFVDVDRIADVVAQEGAIAFDAPDARFGHHGSKCSFDALVEGYGIEDRAVLRMADIIRAADTDPDLAPEGRGLEAVMAGVMMIAKDDFDSLKMTGPIYDALHAYCKAEVIKREYASEIGNMGKNERRALLRRKVKEWIG